MSEYLLPLELMVEQLGKLPGVGRKTAAKYAFSLLKMDEEELEIFTATLINGKRRIKSCSICFNMCEDDRCDICKEPARQNGQICVVEDVKGLMAMERSCSYKGRYHILGGALSPIDGIGPERLHIGELIERVTNEAINEVIVATNPTIEGETTAMYLMKLLKPFDIRVTRLAYGMPVGADIEYADEITLARAIEGRKDI